MTVRSPSYVDTSPTRWARRYADVAGATPAMRLLCFHYAGGGASGYRDWRLPEWVGAEVWAVQLPGRENRMAEAPLRRLAPLLDELAAELAPLLDGAPFAFFGHSMGALVAFELARHLRRSGQTLPTHLFLSGHRAPELPAKRGPVSHLPEPEFLARLDAMAGDSASAVRDESLLRLLMPMMRADFELCEHYEFEPQPPLPVPFTCFAAQDDYEVDVPDVAAWAAHTSHSCRTHTFAGGHLFVRDNAEEIIGHLTSDLVTPPLPD